MNQDEIGYPWLAHEFGITPVQPFPIVRPIKRVRPAARPAEHLAFALKHEGVHLEFLARLFATMPQAVLEEWVNREPSGQYARRAGFFYEWFTGKVLDFPGVSVGNYVMALSEDHDFTRSIPLNVPRWRVRNNLPGTPQYCPTIRRNPRIKALEQYDCMAQLNALESEFGTDLLLRSAVWLTLKESRASFQIEHEEAQSDRIRRFASVMERRLGAEEDPLDADFLSTLQRDILGERALRTGPRRSPVFVGETGRFGEIVHYFAPHWDKIPELLEGLRTFAGTTQGRSSLIRAAVLSFGFVFIHPMTDGNGRISRFLVNDTLRRDGATPMPYLLPISATITHSVANRAAYDRALEHYSKPLMQRYRDACSFGPLVECEDGIKTDFHFAAYPEAQFYWAFPDLTAQCEYLGTAIQETIESEMRQEARFLEEFRQIRARVKDILEAPDREIDRMIRSIQENKGLISGKLRKEFPILEDPSLSQSLVAAVMGS